MKETKNYLQKDKKKKIWQQRSLLLSIQSFPILMSSIVLPYSIPILMDIVRLALPIHSFTSIINRLIGWSWRNWRCIMVELNESKRKTLTQSIHRRGRKHREHGMAWHGGLGWVGWLVTWLLLLVACCWCRLCGGGYGIPRAPASSLAPLILPYCSTF